MTVPRVACLALSPSLDVTYLVDELVVGGIHRPRTTLKLPGGKALNVARALASHGEPTTAIALLGGLTGQLIERMLEGSGVDVAVVRVPGETRSCVTIADGAALTEIYEPATPVAAPAFNEIERLTAALAPGEASWLVLSGSVPAGIDLAALGRMLADRREAGIRIAIDTHGPALAALVDLVHPDLVKVNRVEATALLGERADASLETLAAGIRERTGGLVIVTDGAHGSLALDGSGPLRSEGVPRPGHYAVGSGDCFLAGFLFGARQGFALGRSLATAAEWASANAAVPGAALFGEDVG